jgi:DNA invertase Pin-like site-specific DNA recombinase
MNDKSFDVDAETGVIVIESFEQALETLQEQRDEIDQKILRITSTLKKWRAKFCPKDSNSKGRLKKGEADRLIATHFATFPAKGFTIAEIATATGVNFSSVRNVLTRDTAKYEIGSDNLWRLKKQA